MKSILLICTLFFVQASAFAKTEYDVTTANLKLPYGWSFGEVVGIVENLQGHKYIFNRGEHPLLEFDKNGEFIKEIGHGQFSKPHGLRLDRKGNIWTTDTETHLVQRFAPNGHVTMVLGMKNKASEGWFDRGYSLTLLNSPHDVAFDKSDNIFVVDKGNHRIIKFNPDGLLLKTWGQKGDKTGEFNFAHSIVIDKSDRVLIADRENKRIQLFDLNGNFISQWADLGYPYVLVLANDSLWFTDARHERIQQLDLNGKLLQTIQGKKGRNLEQFGFAHGLHVTKKEHIFVTQVLNWSVLLLKPKF
jgi:sugar lactone lactonase YvrE